MSRKYHVTVSGKTYEVEVLHSNGESLELKIEEKEYEVRVSALSTTLSGPTPHSNFARTSSSQTSQPKTRKDSNTLYAPMPGLVVSVDVKVGDSVTSGTQLMTLEAMKMENGVNAPRDAIIKEILVSNGDQVEANAPLITFE